MHYFQNPHFCITELDQTDEYQLINTQSNLGVYINQSAAYIWTMLASGATKSELVAHLSDQYNAAQPELEQHVDSAIAMLIYHGALLEKEKINL